MEERHRDSDASHEKESATGRRRARGSVTRPSTAVLPRLLSHVQSLYLDVLDVAFPVTCVGCERGGAWLCETCENAIVEDIGVCLNCRMRTLHGRTCRACQSTVTCAGICAVGSYRDPRLQASVRALKFEGVRDLGDTLGSLLARRVTTVLGSALPSYTLVPVPLHVRRERARGFNQASLIAATVARRLDLPVLPLLERARPTVAQTSINADAGQVRQQNVADAFRIRQDTVADGDVPSSVILVDDVATTGATLEASARVLYHHGAKDIWGAVICRG